MTGGPTYPPEEVERLARDRRVTAKLQVQHWLGNHVDDPEEKIIELLTSLQTLGRFHKSDRLRDGHVVDIYYVFSEEDESDWYVKFYVEDGALVILMSCCWDGSVH